MADAAYAGADPEVVAPAADAAAPPAADAGAAAKDAIATTAEVDFAAAPATDFGTTADEAAAAAQDDIAAAIAAVEAGIAVTPEPVGAAAPAAPPGAAAESAATSAAEQAPAEVPAAAAEAAPQATPEAAAEAAAGAVLEAVPRTTPETAPQVERRSGAARLNPQELAMVVSMQRLYREQFGAPLDIARFVLDDDYGRLIIEQSRGGASRALAALAYRYLDDGGQPLKHRRRGGR